MRRRTLLGAAIVSFGASLFACGGTDGQADHPCGTGTVWDGSHCVVKPVGTAPVPDAGSITPTELDLGIQGKAPGPCKVVVKAGPPDKLEDAGITSAFTYTPTGTLSSKVYRYPVKTAPGGYVDESTTFKYDQNGRIAMISAVTGMGIVDQLFAYNASGLIGTQTVKITKSFGSTEQAWVFSYDGGKVASWLWHDTIDEGSNKKVSLHIEGTNKLLIDCEVYKGGALIAGTCWYEHDEKGRITRYVEQDQGTLLREKVFSYEGDRYFEWKFVANGERHSGSRITYDNYGNVAYIDWSLAASLPNIERSVYDYTCWRGKELPSPPAACAEGGRPDAFLPGSCFERMTAASTVY